MRPHSDADYRAIKTAFRQSVMLVGGLHAAASVTRVGASQLADYYHPQKLDTSPTADVVMDLAAVAQQPLVLAEMARILGYRLVPLDRQDGAQLAALIAESARESADVPAAFLDGLGDGDICRADAAEVERHALEAANSFTRVAAVAGALASGIGHNAATISPALPRVKGEGQPADRRLPSEDGSGRFQGQDA
jgi:hypothetical protein